MNITNAPEGTIRAALRYTAFRRLTAGLAVSQVGDWLYNLALITLVYERTGSVLWAGVTSAARVVPMVALGPLGGVAERAGLGVHGCGYLFAGIGIGGLVGTGLAGRAMRFPRPRVILLAAMAAVGLPMLLLVVTRSAPAAISLVGLTGVGAILVEISTETVLQRTLPPEMFGRAYGLAIPAAIAGIVIGSLIAPALTSVVGGTGALVACGGAAMGYAALVLASATADQRRRARRHAGRALHRRLLAEL